MLDQPASYVDGSMTPARAADTDRQLLLSLPGVERQDKIQELEQASQKWLERRVGRYESGRCIVVAGKRLQLGNVVRVAQKTNVEQ